jgi:hypothetical protein
MTQNSQTIDAADEVFTPQWGENAPRGARTVLQRILKEGANVPLFMGQTLVNSMRDLGYNDTISAVQEHVDNAVQEGATEIRIYFVVEGGRTKEKRVDVLAYDNGNGMSPNVLRASMAFGGSMYYDNRKTINRYGVGMKAAGLSMGPELDVWSWQEPGAYYSMILDLEDISNDKANVVYLPEATLAKSLPPEVVRIMTWPMSYPKNANESQELFAADADELQKKLGAHGTVIYIPNCDRVTNKEKTLVDRAVEEMSRVYRRQIANKGLRLYVNNRRVEPFDPTYSMPTARHTRVEGLTEKCSRLVQSWPVAIPEREQSTTTHEAKVRLFFLPIADWDRLPRKIQKNDLKVFDTSGISFMRNDREVHLGTVAAIVGKRGTRDSWWRLEVDFPATLDEAFGVAVNKQGVRPKGYVCEAIKKVIRDDLGYVRKQVDQYWGQKVTAESQTKMTEAERRANEAEALQATLLPQPMPQTPEEAQAIEQNLRQLASDYKLDGETDDAAFERLQRSRYLTHYIHNEDAAFYRVDYRLGKVILTINRAHPFFEKLYKPLGTISKAIGEDTGDEYEVGLDPETVQSGSDALVTLQLLLLSLGRTQAEMILNDKSGELQQTFDRLRRQWSINLATQLLFQ